jgi:hypothetical protein
MRIIHAVDNMALVSLWQHRRLGDKQGMRDVPEGPARRELAALRAKIGERHHWSMVWQAAHPERDNSRGDGP